MELALEQAHRAQAAGEVPVGAVLVRVPASDPQAPELVADLPSNLAERLPSNDPLSLSVRRLLPQLTNQPQPSELLERVRGSEDAPLLAEIFASLLTEPLEKEALSAELDGIVAQIERDELDAELAGLQQAAQRGSLSPIEKARYAELLQSLQQLGRTGRRR